MNDTNAELIDVLDDTSIVVKDRMEITQPKSWSKRRFFLVLKGNTRSKIVFNTRTYERNSKNSILLP